MRLKLSRKILALAAGGALVTVAACGGGDDGDGGEGDGETAEAGPLIVGTTDDFTTVDPAGSYSKPDWGLLYNVGQTLLTVPPGESQPVPDLADSCDFTDDELVTYECTLVEDAQFSDGSPLTSADVKHSFDRMVEIAHEQGPSSLFVGETEDGESTGLESVEAPDDQTVVFNLTEADATFPYRLTTAAATIVPESFPADELAPNDPEQLIFSGPYQIASYDPDQQIQLEPNENYTGDKELSNSGVLIQPYGTENQLKTQIEQGEVHVAYRSLNPTILADLEENGAERGVQVISGDGTEISYIVFATSREPFDQVEVRQAVASLIDREVIASEVYNDTVAPLYSIVPNALDGHEPVFEEEYGADPDVDRATQLLDQAGVETPLEIELWYQSERYGEESADMYAEIARQLEDSGLFRVSIDTTAWAQYQEAYADAAYDGFQLGWFPDFPDADNYLSPFYATNNFIGDGYGYSNPRADQLLAEQKSEAELEDRLPIFGELQRLGAEEAPVIPLWQRDMTVAARDGVTGVEDTIDAAVTFRYWLVAPPTE